MTKLEEACHALLKAWADGFAIGDEISAIRRILFASAALSEPVTLSVESSSAPHYPPRPNGCTCYGEAPTMPVYRLDTDHKPHCPAFAATPSPAPEPVGRTCCEATREAAAKVLDEVFLGRMRPVVVSKILNMPLPTTPPAPSEPRKDIGTIRDRCAACNNIGKKHNEDCPMFLAPSANPEER